MTGEVPPGKPDPWLESHTDGTISIYHGPCTWWFRNDPRFQVDGLDKTVVEFEFVEIAGSEYEPIQSWPFRELPEPVQDLLDKHDYRVVGDG